MCSWVSALAALRTRVVDGCLHAVPCGCLDENVGVQIGSPRQKMSMPARRESAFDNREANRPTGTSMPSVMRRPATDFCHSAPAMGRSQLPAFDAPHLPSNNANNSRSPGNNSTGPGNAAHENGHAQAHAQQPHRAAPAPLRKAVPQVL